MQKSLNTCLEADKVIPIEFFSFFANQSAYVSLWYSNKFHQAII